MKELNKLNLKIELYKETNLLFICDSLNNEEINPIFQAIDLNLYNRLKPITRHYNDLNLNNHIEDRNLNKLFNGERIVLNGGL